MEIFSVSLTPEPHRAIKPFSIAGEGPTPEEMRLYVRAWRLWVGLGAAEGVVVLAAAVGLILGRPWAPSEPLQDAVTANRPGLMWCREVGKTVRIIDLKNWGVIRFVRRSL